MSMRPACPASKIGERGRICCSLKVLVGRVEARLMEGHESPGCGLRRRQILLHPLPQRWVVPVYIGVRVEDSPMAVAVVKGVVRHPRITWLRTLLEHLLGVRAAVGQDVCGLGGGGT